MKKPDEAEARRLAALKTQDRLDDLLAGLDFWRQHKVSSADSTTADEMLMRWLERNEEIYS